MSDQRPTGYLKYLSFMTNRLLETAVWTFAELNIADLLAAHDTPQTADKIAQEQGWDSEALYRLLRTVVDADIVREIISNETIQPEKTNCFELTGDGRFLMSSHPSKLRYCFCWGNGSLLRQAACYLPN